MRLSCSIFYTDNIQHITAFYRDVLGFEFAYGDKKFASFKLENAFLGIKLSENERELSGHQAITLDVDNVQALYESTINRGITIYKELSSEDWGDNFAILDPDGNKVEFVQKRP